VQLTFEVLGTRLKKAQVQCFLRPRCTVSDMLLAVVLSERQRISRFLLLPCLSQHPLGRTLFFRIFLRAKKQEKEEKKKFFLTSVRSMEVYWEQP